MLEAASRDSRIGTRPKTGNRHFDRQSLPPASPFDCPKQQFFFMKVVLAFRMRTHGMWPTTFPLWDFDGLADVQEPGLPLASSLG
jgi:hypothetical protein